MSDKTIKELAVVLAGLRNAGEIESFMRALLTPQERSRIALRWRLVCLLAQGEKQRAIARRLKVSLCKITRGSRELKKGPSIFRETVCKAVKTAAKEQS